MRAAQLRNAVRHQVARIAARRPEPRWLRVALAAAVAVVAGLGLVAVAGRDGGAEATVRAFFEARRDGDCERLLGLVSEASWSQGGRLDRDGFVESCEEVVEHFGPDLGDVEVAEDDGDLAVVTLSVPLGPGAAAVPGRQDGFVVRGDASGETRAYATGTLVREGRGWRVETDQELLRIGRSPEDTLRSYLEARADGNCEEVADLVSAAAWSATGAQTRDGFVERCTESTAPDRGLQLYGSAPAFEISRRGDQVTAVAETPGATGPEPSTETLTLVQDGLAWKLDHDIEAVALRRVRALVVDPPAAGYEADIEGLVPRGVSDPSGLFDEYEGSDAAERRYEAGFERGAIVRFAHDQDYITVVLYEFGQAEGARGYADRLAERVGLPADPRAPRDPAAAPFAGATRCDDPDCRHATEAIALAAHDHFLVAVKAIDYIDGAPTTDELVDRARRILRDQTDRLP